MPQAATPPDNPSPAGPGLARRLNAFDATMLVMGGIVGAGIFVSPHVVARHVQSPALILGAWIVGGAIALIGAFIYAELAALGPAVGGVYAYIRDAFHPLAAFLYGWTLLLVVQSGGMAAVAVTFARYFNELTGVLAPEQAIAVAALALLTAVNWAGVRAGSNVQSALMVMKIVAILGLVTIGWGASGWQGPAGGDVTSAPPPSVPRPPPLAFAAALVPVLFAYGGWQTASFISGEVKEPRRDLPRGLLVGISAVVVLYLAVNAVCLRALGPAGLAATPAPASAVMRAALGETGARLIAAAIATSTIGFLSQSMLTAPRVYFAMARDGLFFRRIGSLDPRTRAPAAAIALQGAVAAIIAFLPYDRILNYVVAIDAVFFGLTGAALLVFRRREELERDKGSAARLRTPGHPATTMMFVAVFWLLALSTVYQFPRDAGVGVLILLAGVPVYLFWRRRER
jgi:APA family basic amino acid/polyamine antiporter